MATDAPALKDSSIELYRPTLPAGPVPSSELFLSILNASAQALLLQETFTNQTGFKDCWMCFDASPPFYEGIAIYGNPIFTNDAEELYLDKLEITITDLSGMGSCICSSKMRFPLELEDICNDTIIVETQGNYTIVVETQGQY